MSSNKENINSDEKTLVIQFVTESMKALMKIAQKYGLEVPVFPTSIHNGMVIMNVVVYRNAEEKFAKLYVDNADKMGLNPDWLGRKFSNHDKTDRYELLGINLAHGENCVQVKSLETGEYYCFHPAAAKQLIILSQEEDEENIFNL